MASVCLGLSTSDECDVGKTPEYQVARIESRRVASSRGVIQRVGEVQSVLEAVIPGR